MTWEWKIGDPVDDSNGGTMDAMNWGHGSDDEEDDHSSESNGGHSSYGSYRPQPSREQRNLRRLSYKKDDYERKLKEARRQTNDEYRIKYYGEALKCAEEYFEESEKLGITVDGMPDRKHLLSKDDIEWISKKHYDEFFKLHILSTDQTANLEKLLKESGNGERIKSNEETRRTRSEENARRRGIDYAKYLMEDYFKHIEKANELILKNKPRHAIKQYQKAISSYEDFFQSNYATNTMKRQMPERKLTSDDVDKIMIIYKKTHPLLTSNKRSRKINGEIREMLSWFWDDRLDEADREVAQILEQRNLERQKRKEKVEGIAVDVIVGARIVGNSILNRFRR